MSTNPTDPIVLDLSNLTQSEAHAALMQFGRAVQKLSTPETMFTGDPLATLAEAARQVNETLLPLNAPEPTMREHEAEKALTKVVRELAEALRAGWTLAEVESDPDWIKARALYFQYCGGCEDALYEKTAFLAAAVRKNDPHWFGQIALDAWNEYADKALVKRVNEKVQELNEDDAAVRQAESVGK